MKNCNVHKPLTLVITSKEDSSLLRNSKDHIVNLWYAFNLVTVSKKDSFILFSCVWLQLDFFCFPHTADHQDHLFLNSDMVESVLLSVGGVGKMS